MTEIRLHVLLSRAGVASRRKAEDYIREGRVRVNGRVVQTLGAKADPERDDVSVDGVSVGSRQPATTLVLNKPVEVVTTLSDPEDRETVADLVAAEPYRFLPVGRLDYHTEGLLLMTTDGELSHRLLHPRYHVPKVYQVKVRGRTDRLAVDQLREGVLLDDGRTRPAVVEVLEQGPRWTWLEIVVAEGRNRLVRRMCDEVGHPALRVVRTELATIQLRGLKPGQFRYLDPAELAALYQTANLPVPVELPDRARDTQRFVLGKARRGKGPLPLDPDRPPAPPAAGTAGPQPNPRGEAHRSTARGRERPSEGPQRWADPRRGRLRREEEGRGLPRARREDGRRGRESTRAHRDDTGRREASPRARREGTDGRARRDGADGRARREGADGRARREGADGPDGRTREGADGRARRDGPDGRTREGADGRARRDGAERRPGGPGHRFQEGGQGRAFREGGQGRARREGGQGRAFREGGPGHHRFQEGGQGRAFREGGPGHHRFQEGGQGRPFREGGPGRGGGQGRPFREGGPGRGGGQGRPFREGGPGRGGGQGRAFREEGGRREEDGRGRASRRHAEGRSEAPNRTQNRSGPRGAGRARGRGRSGPRAEGRGRPGGSSGRGRPRGRSPRSR